MVVSRPRPPPPLLSLVPFQFVLLPSCNLPYLFICVHPLFLASLARIGPLMTVLRPPPRSWTTGSSCSTPSSERNRAAASPCTVWLDWDGEWLRPLQRAPTLPPPWSHFERFCRSCVPLAASVSPELLLRGPIIPHAIIVKVWTHFLPCPTCKQQPLAKINTTVS